MIRAANTRSSGNAACPSLLLVELGLPLEIITGMAEAVPVPFPPGLGPPQYSEERSLHVRYFWWYRVLVEKIHRLCTHTLRRVDPRTHFGSVVHPCIKRWRDTFKVQFSEAWLAKLTREQLEAIYQKLYSLAEELLVSRQDGMDRESAVRTAVRYRAILLGQLDGVLAY